MFSPHTTFVRFVLFVFDLTLFSSTRIARIARITNVFHTTEINYSFDSRNSCSASPINKTIASCPLSLFVRFVLFVFDLTLFPSEHELHELHEFSLLPNILFVRFERFVFDLKNLKQIFRVQSVNCHKTAITTSESNGSTYDSRFLPVISRHKPSSTADKPLPSSIRVGLVRQRPIFTLFPRLFQSPIRLELLADDG